MSDMPPTSVNKFPCSQIFYRPEINGLYDFLAFSPDLLIHSLFASRILPVSSLLVGTGVHDRHPGKCGAGSRPALVTRAAPVP